VLSSAGIDVRAIPKPVESMRWEWSGYPGADDPVHHANFGIYLGVPSDLGNGTSDVAYHREDGSVLLAVVGGTPGATARLPDGSEVQLDALGRITFSPEDARNRGLPSKHTEPPDQIRQRRHFPRDPNPAGAVITLIVDGRSMPLRPGSEYRGIVVERNDPLYLATLRTEGGGSVVVPIAELGVEMRDPKRVDKLFQAGNEVTLGLHRDRRPKLIAHGAASLDDTLRWHQFHAPPWRNVFATSAIGLVALIAGIWWWRRR